MTILLLVVWNSHSLVNAVGSPPFEWQLGWAMQASSFLFSFCSGKWLSDILWQVFSRDPKYRKFCMAHLFTYSPFTSGVLGLAYIGSPRPFSVGGICSPRKLTAAATSYVCLHATDFPRPGYCVCKSGVCVCVCVCVILRPCFVLFVGDFCRFNLVVWLWDSIIFLSIFECRCCQQHTLSGWLHKFWRCSGWWMPFSYLCSAAVTRQLLVCGLWQRVFVCIFCLIVEF